MSSQVIDEPLYTEQIDRLRLNWERLDAAFISFEPVLLNAPYTFPQSLERSYSVLSSLDLRGPAVINLLLCSR